MCPKRHRTLDVIVERSTEEDQQIIVGGEILGPILNRFGAPNWLHNFLREVGEWGGLNEIINLLERRSLHFDDDIIDNQRENPDMMDQQSSFWGNQEPIFKFVNWVKSLSIYKSIRDIFTLEFAQNTWESVQDGSKKVISTARAFHSENPVLSTTIFSSSILIGFLILLPFLIILGIGLGTILVTLLGFIFIEGTILTIFLMILGGILLSVGGFCLFIGLIAYGTYYTLNILKDGQAKEIIQNFIRKNEKKIEGYMSTFAVGRFTYGYAIRPFFEFFGILNKNMSNGPAGIAQDGKTINSNGNGNSNGVRVNGNSNGNYDGQNGIGIEENDDEMDSGDESLAHTD